MNNLNISKEIIEINKNQATSSTQIEPLVFLEESKQVVSKSCFEKHYSNQTSRVFKSRGISQCLHPDCDQASRANFNIMITHKAAYMEEAETKCILCTRGEIFEAQDIFPRKSENSHECENGWDYLVMAQQGKTLLEHLIPIFSAREAINSANPGVTELVNKAPSKYLSGYFVHLERFACNLSIPWPKGEISFEAGKEITLLLKTVIHGEIPWFSTSPEFLLMINKSLRTTILANLRKKLVKLVSDLSEANIDDVLLRLIEKSNDDYEKSINMEILPCFLSTLGLIKLSKYVFTAIDGINTRFFGNRLALTTLIEMEEHEWRSIPHDFRKETENLLSSQLTGNKNLFSLLTEHQSKREIFNKLSKLAQNSSIPNESELTEETDKIHFWIKQIIYGDTSQNEGLSQIQECIGSIKCLLGLNHSIDYSTGTSSNLSPDQKIRLLYNTPLANTLLMTTQLLKEEQFKASKLNKHIPLFASIFSDLLSLSQELTRDCFDTALLWFSNIKTFFCYETLPETAKTQVETFIKTLTKYLFSLSKAVKYRESLLELQRETACELFIYAYTKKLNCERTAKVLPEREEILDSLGKGEQVFDFKTDCAFFLLNSVYPSNIVLQRNDWEYYNEDLLGASSEIKVSLNCLLDCFILPFIECEYLSTQTLLEQKEDSVEFKPKIANLDQISQIVEDSKIDEYAKILIITAFLMEKSRFTFKGVPFEVFDCFNFFRKYKHEYLETLHKKTDLSIKFKIGFTKEIEAIFPVFISLAEKYIKGGNNLLNKVKVYSWASSLMNSTEKESSFYNQNYFLDVYSSTISEGIKGNDVEFKANENSSLFNRIGDFEAGNRLILKNQDELQNFSENLSRKVFPGIEVAVEPEEIKENSLISLFPFKNEVSVQNFVKTCFFLENDTNLQAVQLRLDLLLGLVSGRYPFKIASSDLKTVLPSLSASFLYFFVQFCSSVNCKASNQVLEPYFNVTIKFIRFFRLLVDSNNMEMRELLATEEIKLNFTLLVAKDIYGRKDTANSSLLEILINCVLGYVKASNDADISHLRPDFASNPLLSVFSSVLDLIGEIIEGGSEEVIEKGLKLAVNGSSSKNKFTLPELNRCFEDFCLKICSELNCSEKQKDKINKSLENSSLVERMRKIKEVDFIEDGLNSVEDSKINKMVEQYYSETNTEFEKINDSFKIYAYLRFKVNFDFETANNPEEIGIITEFLAQISKRVDTKINGKSKEIVFLDSPSGNLIGEDEVETFVAQVNRASIVSKNEDLMNYAVHYASELEHTKEQLSNPIKRIFLKLNLSLIILFCLLFALVEVVLMIQHIDINTKKLEGSAETVFLVLVIVQLALSVGVLGVWLFVGFYPVYALELMRFRVNNNIQKGEETNMHKIQARLAVLMSSLESSSILVICVTDVLALANSSLHWTVSLQLLCFVSFSKNLSNIVKAIRLRGKQLGLISLFLVIMLVIYALLTFSYMSETFQTEDGDLLCLTLGHCLASQVDYGFRMGGGMGDNMPVQEWQSALFWDKFVYSTVHFILFPVIMLNIVAGVIIDTFADLREQTAELEEDKQTICLICGGNRDDIKKEEGCYETHLREKHCVLNYILFVKHILDKPETSLDYSETYIRQKIEERQTDWFPSTEEDLELKVDKLKEQIDLLTEQINLNSNKTEENHCILLEKIEKMLLKETKIKTDKDFEKPAQEALETLFPHLKQYNFEEENKFSFN